MYASSSSLIQGTTSFGINKCDVPISILPPRNSTSNSNLIQNIDIIDQPKVINEECSTRGRTTTFDVYPNVDVYPNIESMSFGQSSTSNGLPPIASRPLRVPQPPNGIQNPMLMKPRRCITPSTSSINSNSTTTFPANPSSTSSLPVYQNPPSGGIRRPQPSVSNSTLPAYNTFANSTLPNRRPHMDLRSTPQQQNSYNSTNSMSRADLMELSKLRQQQINANEDFIDELQRQQHALMLAKRNGLNTEAEAERLRAEIRQEEQMLQRVGATKRDTLQARHEVQTQRQVFQCLQNESHAKDVELRQTAGKLHALQRDLMHQRRVAAANAAMVQQERMNAIQKHQHNIMDELYGEVRKSVSSQQSQHSQQRPKASVGPFQVKRQAPQVQSPQISEKRMLPSYDEIDAARNFNRIPMRPQVQALGKYSSTAVNSTPYHLSQQNVDNNSPWVLRTSAVDTAIIRNDSIKAAKRRSWAHVEQQQAQTEHPKAQTEQPKAKPVSSAKTSQSTKPQKAAIQPQPAPPKQVEQPKKQRNLLSSLFGRKKDPTSSKQKSTVAPVKESKEAIKQTEIVELPKQAPLIEKTSKEVEENKSEPTQRNEPTQQFVDRPKAPIAQEESFTKDNDESVLPDPPSIKSPTSKTSPVKTLTLKVSNTDVLQSVQVIQPQQSITKDNEEASQSDRIQSASPPEDPQQEHRFQSEASSLTSHEDIAESVEAEESEKLTGDEKQMLAATNEIMRQLNALDVDSVRVVNAPKAEIDSDDDLEDDSDAESDKDLYRMQHDVLIQPYEHNLDEYEEEQQTTTEEASSNDGESSTAAEEPQFDEIMRPDGLRSCLKLVGVEKQKKNMKFDPWIIFLNAALEGQLDLVKENAALIPDISQANEEGITALHNAICAGHHNVVKYLVNEHADVNAQDSDGWTPLHCAASCNNLPIAKLLIENGACIFATSVSDSEVPLQKCEESIRATQEILSQSSYDGCFDYLETADKCMGLVNDGKVYAAFEYKAEREDELSFNEGDELKVLTRETGERGIQPRNPYEFMYQIQLPLIEDCLWWQCENKEGKQGLVPRSFLSLYPSWKHKSTTFKHFELPSNATALEALIKQNTKKPEVTQIEDETAVVDISRRDSNATLDPCDNDDSGKGEERCTSSESGASDDVRNEDSPPPLPKPDFIHVPTLA